MDRAEQKIVVGVDASDGARQALRWGLAEGRIRNAQVEALGVWSYLDQDQLTHKGFRPTFDEAAAAQALHDIVAAEVAGYDDVRLTERVVCDLAARALIDASDGATLTVVGARGLGGVKSTLLGSVSDQVTRHAASPVAVIRGDETASRRNEVVVGVDESANARAALRWARAEAAARGAVLRAVRAWQFPPVSAIGWGTAPVEIEQIVASTREALETVLAEAAAETPDLDVEVDEVVEEGHAGELLLETAEGAALLVVGARGHGGFAGLLLGSTSTYCLRHASGPTVVVPAPA